MRKLSQLVILCSLALSTSLTGCKTLSYTLSSSKGLVPAILTGDKERLNCKKECDNYETNSHERTPEFYLLQTSF